MRNLFVRSLIPDMVLLDIDIEGTDGVDALNYVQSNPVLARIPVILLADRDDPSVDSACIALGAVDYMTRDIAPTALLHCIHIHMRFHQKIVSQTAHWFELQNGVISVLTDIIDHRDNTTGGHIKRTSTYLRILLMEMMRNGVYGRDTENWRLETIVPSARLHDVGKIAVSDVILNKPGKLDSNEYAIIQTHALEGESIIETMVTNVGGGAFLNHAKLFAGCHHERWDGTGYPRKLKGRSIPLEGRILAVPDVYDALVSERPYKKPFSFAEAEQIIISGAGTHFDPLVVKTFVSVRKQFREVVG
jgi:putative two-component system response regulator